MWHSRPRLCCAARLPIFERGVYSLLEWRWKIGVLTLDSRFNDYKFSFFSLDGCNELVKSIVEQLDSIFQKLIGDVLHGDTGFFEIGHGFVCNSEISIKRAAYVAVVTEGINGGRGQGIDCIRADQFLNVHYVFVIRIL